MSIQNTKKLMFIATTIAILLAVSILMALYAGQDSDTVQYLKTAIPNNGLGAVYLTLILTLATAIGLPRQVAAISSGYLFGATLGTIIATIAAIFGCIITVTAARYLLHNKVNNYYPEKLTTVANFFNQQTFYKALTIRILPAGSNFLTNILAGTAKVSLLPYFLGSLLGFIPQMTLFSIMGSGIKVGAEQQGYFSVALLVIALILARWLYRRNKINTAKLVL
jgi:uncharacterized membrane protein YdjX (TVP38/TMEM64 family)